MMMELHSYKNDEHRYEIIRRSPIDAGTREEAVIEAAEEPYEVVGDCPSSSPGYGDTPKAVKGKIL